MENKKVKKIGINSFKKMEIKNERDLHVSVVNFIRSKLPELILVGSFADKLNTDKTRLDAYAKGYTKGQPDLMIMNKHPEYNGFAIELKTPEGNGVISVDQKNYMQNLLDNGWKVLVSDTYNDVIFELCKYAFEIKK